MSFIRQAIAQLEDEPPARASGRVAALRGLTVLVDSLAAPLGALVAVERRGRPPVLAEVVGFDRALLIAMPLEALDGLEAGAGAGLVRQRSVVPAGPALLGRIIDGLGRPIDGRGPIRELRRREIDPPPVGAMSRRPIREALASGVRAVDLMATLGRGQRMGIFAGPGVGKSTLLGQIARGAASDVNVIALIGERGREVREFVEGTLGEQGLARSVVVVATGDESPVMRLRAARAACAIAEDFRDAGLDCLLIMDSVTRFAHAQRQVGLASGEPPATKGYTPSVFAALARLLERAGAMDATGGRGGSITGLYTVLVEGDDMTEPIADAARGILDGHLMLSRRLAQRGHFPAIDVLDSVSRVAEEVTAEPHRRARRTLLRLLSRYREVEELVRIGAYARGSDPEADVAIELLGPIEALLAQDSRESTPMVEALAAMDALALRAEHLLAQAAKGRAA